MWITEDSTGSATCRYGLQSSLNDPEGRSCFYGAGVGGGGGRGALDWAILVGDEMIREQ